jgi:GNAT superfamily N-acetyltransferase
MNPAPIRYYKRYQMELDLRRWRRPTSFVPPGYRLSSWAPDLIDEHAAVKFTSFRDEVDALIFPCFGELESCARLMHEISQRDGFLPEATWLGRYVGVLGGERSGCGTIQAIRASRHRANIQNVGVAPNHRGKGLGAALVLASLWGMQQVGVIRACLEVTAENVQAVRLYRRLGFRAAKTIYKTVEDLPDSTLLAAR